MGRLTELIHCVQSAVIPTKENIFWLDIENEETRKQVKLARRYQKPTLNQEIWSHLNSISDQKFKTNKSIDYGREI